MVSISVSSSSSVRESVNMSKELECYNVEVRGESVRVSKGGYEVEDIECKSIDAMVRYVRGIRFSGVKKVYRVYSIENPKLYVVVVSNAFNRRIVIEYRYGFDSATKHPLVIRISSIAELDAVREGVNAVVELWNKL